jgi:hypothetical protein
MGKPKPNRRPGKRGGVRRADGMHIHQKHSRLQGCCLTVTWNIDQSRNAINEKIAGWREARAANGRRAIPPTDSGREVGSLDSGGNPPAR